MDPPTYHWSDARLKLTNKIVMHAYNWHFNYHAQQDGCYYVYLVRLPVCVCLCMSVWYYKMQSWCNLLY